MALRSPRAERLAIQRRLDQLGESLQVRRDRQQARYAELDQQLGQLEQRLSAEQSAAEGPEPPLERLRRALGPQQELEGWCEQVYGPRLEADLAARPELLVEVEFTLVRVADRAGAERLLPALRAGEDLPADGAAVGLVGPRLLRGLTASLREALEPLEPGGVQGPLQLGAWWVLLRLERRHPATLSAEIRHELLQEMLDQDLAAVLAGNAPIHAPELAPLLAG
ncbi:hypothetical protein KBY76_12480 [Synechococcus sp. GreenBA-s]|nr:hypothetical protein [Synechococcus sp. GreenBA-s]